MPPNPSPFLNGVPELLILRLLRDSEMYGYEIVQAIRAASGDTIAFAEGVIYPILHALERDGALTASRRTINGRSRVYYRLTPAGTGRLSALVGQWENLNRAIAEILAEPRHA